MWLSSAVNDNAIAVAGRMVHHTSYPFTRPIAAIDHFRVDHLAANVAHQAHTERATGFEDLLLADIEDAARAAHLYPPIHFSVARIMFGTGHTEPGFLRESHWAMIEITTSRTQMSRFC